MQQIITEGTFFHVVEIYISLRKCTKICRRGGTIMYLLFDNHKIIIDVQDSSIGA